MHVRISQKSSIRFVAQLLQTYRNLLSLLLMAGDQKQIEHACRKALAEIGFSKKWESMCITGDATVNAKYHKLVHYLLQIRLNPSIPWEETKPVTMANVPPYIAKPTSLHHCRSRPTHGSLIPRVFFHTWRENSLATWLWPWYHLIWTHPSSNCAHLCCRSAHSLVYCTCMSFPSSLSSTSFTWKLWLGSWSWPGRCTLSFTAN